MREPNPKYTVPEHLDADALFVEDLMRKHYRRWKDRPYGGIENELSRWAFVIEGIVTNRSPKYFSDEYQNDLARRVKLAEMLQAAEQHNLVELLHWALPIIDQLDEIFRGHSYPDTEHRVVSRGRLVPAYWFARRMPKHPGIIDSYQNRDPYREIKIDHRPDFRPKPDQQTAT